MPRQKKKVPINNKNSSLVIGVIKRIFDKTRFANIYAAEIPNSKIIKSYSIATLTGFIMIPYLRKYNRRISQNPQKNHYYPNNFQYYF